MFRPAGGGAAALALAQPMSFAASLSGPGYLVDRLGFGAIGAVFAGVVSALLGVGGGIIKVPLMNLAMGVPLKVATATSNMMIGITATSSAVIYLLRDEIDPYIAGPVALGVFVGASVGARVVNRIDTRLLRMLFVVVLLVHGRPDGPQGGGPVSAAVQPPVEPAAGTSADVAWRLESTISRLLVAGTYLAMGLILVGVAADARGGDRPARPRRRPAVRPVGDPGRDRRAATRSGSCGWGSSRCSRCRSAGSSSRASGSSPRATRGSRSSRSPCSLVVLGSIVAAIRLEG